MKNFMAMKMVLLGMFFSLPVLASYMSAAKLYELESNRTKLLYEFKREVSKQGDTEINRTRYFAPDQSDVAIETLELKNKRPQKYTIEHKQVGYLATVEVKDNKLEFSFTKDGKTKTATENLEPNFAIGPTLMSYLQGHWDEILEGKDVNIRYGVLDRRETVGFKLFKDKELKSESGEDLIVVKMKPTSFVIAALVNPVYMTLTKKDARLVMLKGRALPKIKSGDNWKDLDAEIIYSYSP